MYYFNLSHVNSQWKPTLNAFLIIYIAKVLNPIQDEGERGAKRPPISFSPVTSTNIGNRLENFFFSLNLFAALV